MELLQLKYFFESAKNENFARTAEKFMVPSSSVSAAIKRLEKELGCSLFDRKANRIALNENGRRLQKSLCVIFDELEQVSLDLAVEEKDDAEINMLVHTMRAIVTDEIIKFNKKHPSVRFKTSFDFSETDYENYDIIIDEATDKYVEFERFELCSVGICIKAPADSPLAGRPLRLSQLSGQPFISMGEDARLYQMLIKACNKAGFTPNIIVQTNDASCYYKCVDAGMGLSLGRRFNSSDSSSVFLQVADFDERQTAYVYYKKQPGRKNVSDFVSFLKESTINTYK